MSKSEKSRKELKSLIKSALKEFMENDWHELTKMDVHEVAYAHRIAVYLENKFAGYNVDLEYNRDKKNIKRRSNGKEIRPDIIIHKRNNKEHNLCVFEIKKNSVEEEKVKRDKGDISKLQDEVEKFNYKLGVFLAIQPERIEICWIEKICKDINYEVSQ